MPTLMCFGLGYTAEHFVATFGDSFDRIVGTVRGSERAADLNDDAAGGGANSPQVAAGTRLRESNLGDAVSFGKLRQPFSLLLLGARPQQYIRGQVGCQARFQ